MPGFVTHHIFGVKAFKKLPDSQVKRIIKEHHNSYALGLQGPDLFFYFMPTSTGIKPNIGSIMHKEKTGEFIGNLIRSFEIINHKRDFEVATAYVAGYLGHYLLDAALHPYVYYRVGTGVGSKVLGVHFGLESDIDREVLLKYKGLRQAQFSHRKAVDVPRNEYRAIATILHMAIMATYNIDLSISLIRSAIVSFELECELIMDKNNTKHKVINYIESHTLRHPFVSPLLVNDIEHMADPCNIKNKEWYNPWGDSDVIRNDSVFEIFENKVIEYSRLIDKLYNCTECAYLHKDSSLISFLRSIGNLSLTSGLDCNIKLNR